VVNENIAAVRTLQIARIPLPLFDFVTSPLDTCNCPFYRELISLLISE
jgi:hypothetical protein